MQKFKSLKKTDWDNTVTDLSVYRLSSEQLAKKHKLFKSKNIEAARKDLYEKTSSNRKYGDREEHTIEQLLFEAEQSLHNVRGMCQETPKRYCVSPIITTAPHVDIENNRTSVNTEQSQTDNTPPTCAVTCQQLSTNEQADTDLINKPKLCQVCQHTTELLQEVQYSNRVLLETVIEQQNTIDILAQDMLFIKQQHVELRTLVSQNYTTVNNQQGATNEQSNDAFVPLPLSTDNTVL